MSGVHKVPAYLRAAGVFMLLLGFVAFTFVRGANDRGTGWILVGQVGTTAVFLLGGVGLVLGQR